MSPNPLLLRTGAIAIGVLIGLAPHLRESPRCMSQLSQRVCRAVSHFFQAIAAKIYTTAVTALTLVKRLVCCSKPKSSVVCPFYVTNQPIARAICDSVSIAREALRRVPAPFDPSIIEYIADSIRPPIEISELITHFDQQFAHLLNWDILYNDEGQNISKGQAKEDIQEYYLYYITETKRTEPSNSYSGRLAHSLESVLKAIIFELRKPDLSSDKKREALESLASAARHCPPRRYEHAFKIYRKLSNQMETMDQILLEQVQEAKEELFRNHYSLSREPVQTLNYIRSVVGEELGLDRNTISLSDPYIRMADARSPGNDHPHTTREQFLAVFQRIYTPANLLSIVKVSLNEKIARDNEMAQMVTGYISQELLSLQRTRDCTQADVDALPEPYQHDYDVRGQAFHLTDEGIRFLLVRGGFLRPRRPNAHIVNVRA